MCVQDQLASLGISYVLSVSRCSPQPSFLPRSRFLRIPIDDSLWDDLLPWIPQALSFIGENPPPPSHPKHLLHSFLCCTTMLMLGVDWFFSPDCASWISHANKIVMCHGAVCADSAMSSGASVLVHCAAGISRSPALAVAYIMYSLEMDLDHAYRCSTQALSFN